LTRLEENLGAVDLELTAADLHEIDGAAANVSVVGDRFPERMEKMAGL